MSIFGAQGFTGGSVGGFSMDPLVTSSLISAGSSLLGGLAGGSGPSPRKLMAQQHYYDQQMMKNQAVWRAKGAKSAKARYGVHPLVSLGMTPVGSSVSAIGGSGGRDIGSALANAGQDVSRAVHAFMTREQREEAKTLSALSVERAGLENELLRSQIATQRSQIAPAISDPYDALHYGPAKRLGSSGKAPLHVISIDDHGRPMRVYNSQDLGDSEILSAAHAATYGLTDFLHTRIGKPAGKWLARKYKRFFR